MKSGRILKEGIVEEALPGLTFRVTIREDDSGKSGEVLAHLAGRLKINHIKVIPGDRVMVELSPYDKKRGRVVRRL